MNKEILAKKIGVLPEDIIMFKERGHQLDVLYKLDDQYIHLSTDDIDDESEGGSFATPNYEEALKEYENS